MALQLKLITVDAGQQLRGCDQDREETLGRAACFPLVEVVCCGVVIARQVLNVERNCSIGCRLCGTDTDFSTDGLGNATINRIPI